MVGSCRYEFKELDRLRSICIVPKDEFLGLLNFKDGVSFSLDYPKYIYIECSIEISGTANDYNLNMPGR